MRGLLDFGVDGQSFELSTTLCDGDFCKHLLLDRALAYCTACLAEREVPANTVKLDLMPISNSFKFILASPSMSNLRKIATSSSLVVLCPVFLKNLLMLFRSSQP